MAAGLAALVVTGCGGERREVMVSVAASLADVLTAVETVYEQRGAPYDVVLNTGASNALARQIASGARVDVFISADRAQLDAVRRLVVPGTAVDLLGNQLAIVVPADRAALVRAAGDLASPSVRRVAIGDPAAVPAGVYAKAYLEKAGLWGAVEPKVVPTGTVRLALSAAQTGAVDAAIVYRTDVRTASGVHEAVVIPPADAPEIVYPAAVMATGANPEGGRAFLRYLRESPLAASAFEEAGFLRPPAR
jgi:molybdate transport system substrate-binding protein